MKIDNPQPFSANRALPEKPVERASHADGTPAPGSPAAVTHLNRDRHGDGDIDSARVAEIHQAIREGRLDIRADRIADALIERVREDLGLHSNDS